MMAKILGLTPTIEKHYELLKTTLKMAWPHVTEMYFDCSTARMDPELKMIPLLSWELDFRCVTHFFKTIFVVKNIFTWKEVPKTSIFVTVMQTQKPTRGNPSEAHFVLKSPFSPKVRPVLIFPVISSWSFFTVLSPKHTTLNIVLSFCLCFLLTVYGINHRSSFIWALFMQYCLWHSPIQLHVATICSFPWLCCLLSCESARSFVYPLLAGVGSCKFLAVTMVPHDPSRVCRGHVHACCWACTKQEVTPRRVWV